MSMDCLPAELLREVLVRFVGDGEDIARFDSAFTNRSLRNTHYLPSADTVAIIQAYDHHLNRLDDVSLLASDKVSKVLRCTLEDKAKLPAISIGHFEVKNENMDKINWFLSCLSYQISCLAVRSDVVCGLTLLMALQKFCATPGRQVRSIHLPNLPADVPPTLMHGLLSSTTLTGLRIALPKGIEVTALSALQCLRLSGSSLLTSDLLPLLARCRSTLCSLDLHDCTELTERVSVFALSELPALRHLSLPSDLLGDACLSLPRWPPLCDLAVHAPTKPYDGPPLFDLARVAALLNQASLVSLQLPHVLVSPSSALPGLLCAFPRLQSLFLPHIHCTEGKRDQRQCPYEALPATLQLASLRLPQLPPSLLPALLHILRHCGKHLQALEVGEGVGMELGVEMLSSLCPRLRSLGFAVGDPGDVVDSTLSTVPAHFPLLQHVRLSHSVAVSAATLLPLLHAPASSSSLGGCVGCFCDALKKVWRDVFLGYLLLRCGLPQLREDGIVLVRGGWGQRRPLVLQGVYLEREQLGSWTFALSMLCILLCSYHVAKV